MMIDKGIEDIDIRMPNDAYDTGKDVSTFNAYLVAVVRDYEGRVIKVHRQRSHSPTANFIGLLLPLQYYMNNSSGFTFKNASGSTRTYQPAVGCATPEITYPNNGRNFPTTLL
jgi:hypothetical protein